MTAPLIAIRDLHVHFPSDAGVVRAVDGVSYDILPGETLAVVGESGSGKSVTALTILRLTEVGGGERISGAIEYRGDDLLRWPLESMRKLRGNQIAMIFQEPMTSLNPVYTIGNQLREPLTLHRGLSEDQAHRESVRLLDLVGIPAAKRRVGEYPHQLSGGMRQRVMIAMALACDPKLLIADEPTTALDVTIQAQILELLQQLQKELGMSILLITHDLGVVAEIAHRVVVMYAGKVVERGGVMDIFERPQHPYTAGLMQSVPRLDSTNQRLLPIAGNVPDPTRFPSGCRFHPRCRFRLARCDSGTPELVARRAAAGGVPHQSACFYRDEQTDADFLRDEPVPEQTSGRPA